MPDHRLHVLMDCAHMNTMSSSFPNKYALFWWKLGKLLKNQFSILDDIFESLAIIFHSSVIWSNISARFGM